MAEAAPRLQPRRWGVRALTFAVAALVSACSTVVPRGPAPPPPAPTAPRPTAPHPVQSGIPEDTERHRVALLVPITGTNGAVGRSLANATQLALLDTRSERVRITTYDTAPGAAAAAQRAIAEGAQLILGPLLAEDVRAVAPIARRARVPVVSFSNDASVAGQGAYLMGYSPAQSIERVVDYAKNSGVTRFAGLMPTGLYGERASTAFLRAVEGAGGSVTAIQTYDRRPGGVTAAVARLGRASGYQAVLIADSAGTASVAVPALRRSGGAGVRVLGTELWNTDSSVGGNAALAGAWFASVPDALYRQYATRYRTRFGAAPYRLSSLGYDAVLLTVRIARDWRVGDNFPEGRLSDRDGFAGLDGAFRFGRDGVADRALEVQEIRGGQTVTVSPAPQGFGGR
ncbi:amino acid/amide ABC transporter substrate-binding protein, HAAT family [Sphingomonas guangdongensis]|uniref:Amino acid/amide ABC transporter substrate-binding protein, HAAT family n=1 Tax=Sphingomonas guangdongensis TaxID=1141890 RepID=A0A285QC97_9SPHN|nr:penicillin-binding protein activator [Sphingomonas guangdongensis]SOB79575.1 amino acid/amide ABC transporter substrate-binding protein, HAAT family [Sphingomonas guangdongensis]